MTNAEIAASLDLVADPLEFQEANPFRVRAYRNAGRADRRSVFGAPLHPLRSASPPGLRKGTQADAFP